jgi:hypothetical protein
MARFKIENTVSGTVIGEFDADDEQDALDAMAREAGYRDHAEACEVAPTSSSEMRVIRVS